MHCAYGHHDCEGTECNEVEVAQQYPTTPWVLEMHMKQIRGFAEESLIELTVQQEIQFCPFCGKELER